MTVAKVNSIFRATETHQIGCTHRRECLGRPLWCSSPQTFPGSPAMGSGDDGISDMSFSTNTSKKTTCFKVFNPEYHPHERGTII